MYLKKLSIRNFHVFGEGGIDVTIDSVNDLRKLQPFLEDCTLKINKSQIARELDVNRKTVDKYLSGFQKSDTRPAMKSQV